MPTVKKRRVKSSSSRNLKAETKSSYSLPLKPNEPPEELADSVIAIYGRKGIGKSTLANQLNIEGKKTLTMMAEKGRRNLRILQVTPHKFEDAIGYRDEFLGSDKYGLFIADTIDRIHEMATAYVCEEAGVKGVLKAPQGDRPALWNEIAAVFGGFFWPILEAQKGLVLISHEQTRELENRKVKALKKKMYEARDGEDEDDLAFDSSGEKIERIQPSCSPAAFREIEQICNFVFYYGYMGRERCITVRDPGDYVWVSSGDDEHFLDPDGEPIYSFAVGNSPEKAYNDLLAAYNNELRDINYKPPRRKKTKTKRRTT
jgi:hypothetical protein